MKVGSVYKILILCLFCLFSFSIQARSYWRWQLDNAYQQTRYSEKRDGQSFEGSRFSQKSVASKVSAEWLIFPKWFYIGGDVEYSSPLSSEGDFEFSMLRQTSRAAIVFNSRPFHVSLVAEQFYQDFRANEAGFGYESINGTHFYPRLDFSFPSGSRFYIESPLVSNIDGRKLMVAGFELRFTGKQAPFPIHLFQRSPLLKFEYLNEELKFKEAQKVDIKTESFTLSLSFNF